MLLIPFPLDTNVQEFLFIWPIYSKSSQFQVIQESRSYLLNVPINIMLIMGSPSQPLPPSDQHSVFPYSPCKSLAGYTFVNILQFNPNTMQTDGKLNHISKAWRLHEVNEKVLGKLPGIMQTACQLMSKNENKGDTRLKRFIFWTSKN